MKKPYILSAALALLLTVGCAEQQTASNTGTMADQTASAADAAQSETERLNAFFEEVFERDVARSPMYETYLGGKRNYGELDDISEKRQDEDIALVKADLKRLRSFDYDKLDDDAKLSYRIFETLSEREIEGDRWRHHDYPVNQMFGWQSELPAFFITAHQVDDVSDAEAYVSRLNQVDRFMGQLIDGVKLRASKGVLPPRFVFPTVIENSRHVITGAPFDESGEDSALMADFRGKVEALDISAEEKKRLIDAGIDALRTSVRPAYERLIATLTELEKQATTDDGAWKLPDGDKFYAFRLRAMTTTDMTADEIHEFGLKETARIQAEMREIMKKVGFKGTLKEFFAYLDKDPRFYYPQSEEGKARYIAEANRYIQGMRGKLGEFFEVLPQADVEVRAVEPFREKGAPGAFYQPPALDGSRPAYFYVNTHDMKAMPTYQLEALVYHEAIPGHHLQIAIAQELENVPMFRKMADFTAFIEGWGLYAERLGKDMGFYEDPYSDFGRLAMEIWRAGRLVVDTGIHAKRWTREQAIAWLAENTPIAEGDNIREVERYIVLPGQATAYKIGMTRILELRERARQALGDRFDIRAFHNVVLRDGALPLNVLEQNVEDWIAQQGQGLAAAQ